jgi:hypothetical protein
MEVQRTLWKLPAVAAAFRSAQGAEMLTCSPPLASGSSRIFASTAVSAMSPG